MTIIINLCIFKTMREVTQKYLEIFLKKVVLNWALIVWQNKNSLKLHNNFSNYDTMLKSPIQLVLAILAMGIKGPESKADHLPPSDRGG